MGERPPDAPGILAVATGRALLREWERHRELCAEVEYALAEERTAIEAMIEAAAHGEVLMGALERLRVAAWEAREAGQLPQDI